MDIDIPLVSRLVSAQFPQWANLPIRRIRPNGWDNRTFRLGDNMSVRLPSAECYSGQVEKEHDWLPRLAPPLPLPIPFPLAMGHSGEGYPWNWSVYRWIEGEKACTGHIDDLNLFATTLAEFLVALTQIDSSGGPIAGPHSFYRGGPLATYDAETRQTIESLGSRIDKRLVTEVWETSLASNWQTRPVWLHGDFNAANLIVQGGRLVAVIDFGCMGIGDPACDMTIAWSFLSRESRKVFRTTTGVDDSTWQRGRGWTLWKALTTLLENDDAIPKKASTARRTIDELLADYRTFD